MAQEILANSDAIDFIIKGEGEYPLLKLIQSLSSDGSFNHIKGLAYRGKNLGGSVKEGHNMVSDFNLEPSLIKKLFIASEKLPYFKKGASILIEASRGCRYSCKFCIVNDISGSDVRYKKPEDLVGEIEAYLVNFGVNNFKFIDSTFTADREFVYKVSEQIMARNLQKKIKWGCTTRVDCLDESLLKDMKRAGCYRMLFGVESYSQQDLDYYNKRIILDKVKDAFSLVKEAGINTKALLLFNQYKHQELRELKEESGKLMALLRIIKADDMAYTPLIIYPNTLIYEDYLKTHAIEKEGWRALLDGHLIPSVFMPEGRILRFVNRVKLSFLASKLLNRL